MKQIIIKREKKNPAREGAGGSGYKAWIKGDKGTWEWGKTRDEVLNKLYQTIRLQFPMHIITDVQEVDDYDSEKD